VGFPRKPKTHQTPAFCVVTTTVDSAEVAAQLADAVVRARAAACAQVGGPITSTYWWQGEVQTSTEWTVAFKSTRAAYPRILDLLSERHPYDVPEIICTPIADGSTTYLDWIRSETSATWASGSWLIADGWSVERDVEYVDVLARRDGVTLYAEAKGRTSGIGLDVDTLYGQLLRRIPAARRPMDRFAVVVPREGAAAACRVPIWVRQALAITIHSISDAGSVTEVCD
jgi:periplasmic divalent cation tolerance protein